MKRSYLLSSWVPLVAAILLCAGCNGSLEEPQRPSGNGEPVAQSQSAGSGSSSIRCGDTELSAKLPPRILLLSDYQHLNALKMLLGATAVNAQDAAENTAQTKPFSQKGVVVNSSVVHQRLSWAQQASVAFETRFRDLTGCASTTPDDACARRFLASFTARAFRRPVADEELNDLMVVYNTAKVASFQQGLKRAVEAMLAAPSFMYRREIGADDANGTVALTPHELASELSFLLTDMPPDPELSTAADKGALSDASEVERQVERLIAKSDVQTSISSTLISAWGVSNLFGTAKDPTLFPEYTPALQAAMFHETELFVRDVLWTRKAPLSELLTSRQSFVNESLATLYGVPFVGAKGEFAPTTLPAERAGILTQASFMSALARTDSTSVVARGLFVRGALLCLPKLSSPPEALADRVQELLKADMTEPERAAVRAKDATCAGCHTGIDPFGLLLERYDALGKQRSTLRGQPIDTSGNVVAGSISGRYDSAVAFAQAAAPSDELAACIGRHLLAYATQNDSLGARDCEVSTIASKPAELTMPALIKAVATSPALRVRTKEP